MSPGESDYGRYALEYRDGEETALAGRESPDMPDETLNRRVAFRGESRTEGIEKALDRLD